MDWKRIGKVTLIAAVIGALIVVRAACSDSERQVERVERAREKMRDDAELRRINKDKRILQRIERYMDEEAVPRAVESDVELRRDVRGYKLLHEALISADPEALDLAERRLPPLEGRLIPAGAYAADAYDANGKWLRICVPHSGLHWVPVDDVYDFAGGRAEVGMSCPAFCDDGEFDVWNLAMKEGKLKIAVELANKAKAAGRAVQLKSGYEVEVEAYDMRSGRVRVRREGRELYVRRNCLFLH